MLVGLARGAGRAALGEVRDQVLAGVAVVHDFVVLPSGGGIPPGRGRRASGRATPYTTVIRRISKLPVAPSEPTWPLDFT
jgi:hypothetical protein